MSTQPGMMQQQTSIPQPGQAPPPAPASQPTPPDNGASLMGVNPPSVQPENQPQPNPNIHGTPYQTPEQLAEGYRNLQAQYTQTNQRYSQLQNDWNSLIQHMSQQQPQQTTQQVAQQTAQSILALEGDAFNQALEANPKQGLMRLAQEVATNTTREFENTIKGLQQQVQATQAILNQQAVNRTLEAMQSTYGSTDPNYQTNLNTAVDMVLGPLKAAAEADPAGTLNMAYEMVLGRQLRDPNFVNQLQQSAVQRQQQLETQKQMAGVTTSQTQAQQPTYQPYNPQPAQQPQGMTPQQIARQIALAGDPSLASGMQNLRVGYNPF